VATDSRVEHILSTQAKLYSDRANFNNLWQSVSERVLPNYSDFITSWVEGQRRTNRIFDSTAPLALNHGCAALESMACPASSRWHSLRPSDPALRADIGVQQWCDQITDCLFRARYAPSANFQSQIGESFAQIMAFGVGPILIDDIVGYGLRYQVLHLAQTFGIMSSAGVIDHVQREYDLTAKAACDAEDRGIFDNKLPEQIRASPDKNPTRKFKFIQAIYPNEDHRPRDVTSKAFTSCIVNVDHKVLVKESGYRTQPILMPRYRVELKETYGRGAGVDVLPEILMLNEMRKAYIRQAQRAIEPPILTADDGSLSAMDLRGNAINYGMLTPDGKPLAVPFNTGTNFEVNKEMLDDARRTVQTAFLNDVFSILIEHPEMTATEVLQRAQEQGHLVAPIIGRIQTELFGPMITREIDILDRAGQLPPPPDKVRKQGGIDFDVVYESEIQVSQRRSKALAVTSVLQQAAPLFELDPKYAKRINGDRTLQILAEANGAPAGMLNTDEEQQASDTAAQQQQQLTNLAQIAGPASQAIKNIGDAQRASGSGVPANIPA